MPSGNAAELAVVKPATWKLVQVRLAVNFGKNPDKRLKSGRRAVYMLSGLLIGRLRDRLKSGDSDLSAEELQAVIAKAEGKRNELLRIDLTPAKGGGNLVALGISACGAAGRQRRFGW